MGGLSEGGRYLPLPLFCEGKGAKLYQREEMRVER